MSKATLPPRASLEYLRKLAKDVIRAWIEQQPEGLDQRLPARDQGQTRLHFAISRSRPDILELLIEMGADLDAPDANGQTALEYALLRNDRPAAQRLRDAGARAPRDVAPSARPVASGFAESITAATVVVGARDVAATLAWYTSIGFTEVARFPADGSGVFWGLVKMGQAELSFDVRETPPASGVSLLVTTDRVREDAPRARARRVGVQHSRPERLHAPVPAGNALIRAHG